MSRAAEVLELLDFFNGNYRREEVEEALTLQEEITPLLIAILEDVATDPVRYASEEHGVEAYAVALLAHFREETAHLPIIRAFSIPDAEREQIWGDMLTETLPALLCRTSGGDYAQVMAIVRNRDAYDFLRASAMEAIKLGIFCGDLSRQEGLAFYATLFDETLAAPENYFWAALVSDLLDLYPVEMIAEIRELFVKGLVSEGDVTHEEVEEVMAAGLDAAMEQLEETCKWRLPEDVHRYISWFACFRENERETPVQQISLSKTETKKKEKSRNKRKQAKVAKRKNRR